MNNDDFDEIIYLNDDNNKEKVNIISKSNNNESNFYLHEEIVENIMADHNNKNSLTLQINTEDQSISYISEMTNLYKLNLNNSYICHFRDISQFRSLEILFLGQCGLTEINGIELLPKLKELHVPLNNIEEVESLMMHPNLTVLDLYANKIRNINQIDFIASCTSLLYLNLDKNPISTLQYYIDIIKEKIPDLKVLDYNYLSHKIHNKHINYQQYNTVKLKQLKNQMITIPKILQKKKNEMSTNALDIYYKPKSISNKLPWDINTINIVDNLIWRKKYQNNIAKEEGNNKPLSKSLWIPNNDINQENKDQSDLTYGYDDALQGNYVLAMRTRRKYIKLKQFSKEESSEEAPGEGSEEPGPEEEARRSELKEPEEKGSKEAEEAEGPEEEKKKKKKKV